MKSQPEFQIGVNYWPARSAMRMWKEFDAGEVREDFARMAEFRLSPVRVFLLWEDFQPEPLRVSTKALDRLVKLCSDAADFRTGVWITLFTGHMSGANWLPGWTLSPDAQITADNPFFRIITDGAVVEGSAAGVVNPYENPDLRKAQKIQIREALSALQGHPALWGWDLGNGSSNVFRPANPDQGRSWLKEMTGEIKSKDNEHPVAFGLSRQDLEEDRGIGPADVARCCDLIAVDACPPYPGWVPDNLNAVFPLFLAEITSWLADWKPVWISGFGVATGSDTAAGEQAARCAAESLDLMRTHGLPGALWRGYSDYAPRLRGNAPFDTLPEEMSCGAFSSDGAPKEIAAVLAGADRKKGSAQPVRGWIDMGAEEYWRDPGAHLRRLFGRFAE